VKPVLSQETDFWSCLEYRVCRELQGSLDPQLRYFWCDGFLPEDYLIAGEPPTVSGQAWICRGSSQDRWEFTLVLPRPIGSRADIDWAALLPPEDMTGWLSMDRTARRIRIEPGIAVQDPE
jgi:hypothetical protein